MLPAMGRITRLVRPRQTRICLNVLRCSRVIGVSIFSLNGKGQNHRTSKHQENDTRLAYMFALRVHADPAPAGRGSDVSGVFCLD